MTHSPFLNTRAKLSVLQMIGASIMLLGIVLLTYIGITECAEQKSAPDFSSLAAISVFQIMIGMALLFPTMLQGVKTQDLSTMRVAVFMIVSLFLILCMKIYWHARPAEFNLDSSWAYVIIAALGGKAVQSLGENKAFSKQQPLVPPDDFTSVFDNTVGSDIPLHKDKTIRTPPTNPPAFLLKTPRL